MEKWDCCSESQNYYAIARLEMRKTRFVVDNNHLYGSLLAVLVEQSLDGKVPFPRPQFHGGLIEKELYMVT